MTEHVRRLLGIDARVCPWWAAFTFDNALRPLIQNPDKILNGLIAPGQTAVDLGCGMGYFTIALARLVGENGRVIAVDLQDKMLQGTRRRAERAGLDERIRLHQCRPENLGVTERADFVLAFWMVHEVPSANGFMAQVHDLLKPTGRFLLVEPVVHVPAKSFIKTVAIARANGLRACKPPAVALSRTALFELG